MQISTRTSKWRWSALAVAALSIPAIAASGQVSASQPPSCPAIAEHPLTPADVAYGEGSYHKAEDLYGQTLAQQPHDAVLSAAFVHALLHNGEIEQAAAQVNKTLADDPHSATTLAALAEVQLRQGQPWDALDTLKQALAADACNARAHLIRSRVLRLDSMYASERAEIQKAYDIDPNDPDIKHAWLSIDSPAQEAEGIVKGLATMKDLDADTKQKADKSLQDILSLLSENSQTCQVLPTVASATLPLQQIFQDPKHMDGVLLETKFPQSNARLQVDTAASGMFISRALADQNGLQARAGDPPGTVHVDSVHIGPLEFRDCMVGVSETPFPNKKDGFIGTDMFASYLITLDQQGAKLTLDPLPAQEGLLPGDRPTAAELRNFTPVYHRRQFLLAPVMLNSKTRKLFAIDTGIRLSTMTPDVAHSISTTKVNFTNAIQTTGGSTVHIYRDGFDFQYANLTTIHQGGVLEFDPAAIDQNAGFAIAGMLGFDMLHSMVLHLDYRDGLVKFEMPQADEFANKSRETMTASEKSGADECRPLSSSEVGVKSAMAVSVPLLMDAGHLKPGKEFYVKMVNGWQDPECTLDDGAFIYGKVTESGKASNGSPQLSLKFERGDCNGHANKPLGLRLIGVVGTADFEGMHDAMPVKVAGGGRSIGDAVVGQDFLDLNLNPGGLPHTIHPGIVVRIPKLQIEVGGGPGCSDRLTTTDSILRLAPKTVFLLARESGK